jgi:predicted DNA-binding protein with PD1-like motif
MRYKRFGDFFILRFGMGEEIVSSLLEFCEKESIRAGTVSAIGAAKDIEIAAFDVDSKEYSKKELKGNHEIISLKGLVSFVDGKPHVHLHITLAGHDFSAKGGHLNRATASPTCEMVVRKLDGELHRKKDEETGLKLLEL